MRWRRGALNRKESCGEKIGGRLTMRESGKQLGTRHWTCSTRALACNAHEGHWVQGLGFRVQVFGFRFQSLGFSVYGLVYSNYLRFRLLKL